VPDGDGKLADPDLPPKRKWKHLKLGEEVEGKVVRLVNFGAFVNIGAETDGLLHISQIPKDKNKISVGDTIQCRIKEIMEDKQRIGLGWKEDLARKTLKDFQTGQWVEGKVLRVVQFGGFVDIGAEVDALLHVSEITDDFIQNASERLKKGDIVKCRIKEVDTFRTRIGLTCKDHVVLEPRQFPCSGAVVWLHGFGDNPSTWAGEFNSTIEQHPTWKWVFLRAPKVPQAYHRKFREWPAWGTYYDEGSTNVGSADYDSDSVINGDTIQEVHRVIDEIINHDEVSPNRIIVGGYSMGAGGAAACGLTYPVQLGGIAMLNGWLPPSARKAVKKRSPLNDFAALISHGDQDEMVGFCCAKEAARILDQAGAVVKFEVQKGEGHRAGVPLGVPLAVKFMVELFGNSSAESNR